MTSKSHYIVCPQRYLYVWQSVYSLLSNIDFLRTTAFHDFSIAGDRQTASTRISMSSHRGHNIAGMAPHAMHLSVQGVQFIFKSLNKIRDCTLFIGGVIKERSNPITRNHNLFRFIWNKLESSDMQEVLQSCSDLLPFRGFTIPTREYNLRKPVYQWGLALGLSQY